MNGYTEGPWHVDPSEPRRIVSATGETVAFCGSFPADEAMANARLIALARELILTKTEFIEKVEAIHPNAVRFDAQNGDVTYFAGEPLESRMLAMYVALTGFVIIR